jgi:hypothetical protein
MAHFFDPERRLIPLLAESTSPAQARAEVEGAIERSGEVPGLYHDEDERLEARWVITGGDGVQRVLNVAFGDEIELYVFDRSTDEIVIGTEVDYDLNEPGDMVAKMVAAVRRGDPAEALWAELGYTWSGGAPMPGGVTPAMCSKQGSPRGLRASA